MSVDGGEIGRPGSTEHPVDVKEHHPLVPASTICPVTFVPTVGTMITVTARVLRSSAS